MQVKYIVHNRYSTKDKYGNRLKHTTIKNTETGATIHGTIGHETLSYAALLHYDNAAHSGIYFIEEHDVNRKVMQMYTDFSEHFGSGEDVISKLRATF
jgi:hypothetical protein